VEFSYGVLLAYAKKVKPMHWVKNVGLGIKNPDAAIEGTYVDKKCPFTGNVSIRDHCHLS
jgi:small subunit ribosomal protein S11e